MAAAIPESVKFVAKGAFGCVLRPGVDLETGQVRPNTVMKLFTKDSDAATQQRNLDNMRRIDPDSTFSVTDVARGKINLRRLVQAQLEPCFVSATELQVTRRVVEQRRRNAFEQSHPEGVSALIFPDAGQSLRDAIPTTSFSTLFLALRPVFHGLQQLASHHMVHADISVNNIMYGGGGGGGECRLIDFGVSCAFDQLYDDDEPVIPQKFSFWPPEFELGCMLHLMSTDSLLANMLRTPLKSSGTLRQKVGLGMRTNWERLTSPPHDFLETLMSRCASELEELVLMHVMNGHRSLQDGKLFSPATRAWKQGVLEFCHRPDVVAKFDVYSFGMVLLTMVVASIRSGQFDLDNIRRDSLMDLIYSMIRPDAHARATAEQAAQAYDHLTSSSSKRTSSQTTWEEDPTSNKMARRKK